jgi:hypothetical protein
MFTLLYWVVLRIKWGLNHCITPRSLTAFRWRSWPRIYDWILSTNPQGFWYSTIPRLLTPPAGKDLWSRAVTQLFSNLIPGSMMPSRALGVHDLISSNFSSYWDGDGWRKRGEQSCRTIHLKRLQLARLFSKGGAGLKQLVSHAVIVFCSLVVTGFLPTRSAQFSWICLGFLNAIYK